MSLDMKERAQHRMRLIVGALVGLLVLLVLLVVALVTAGGGTEDKGSDRGGGKDRPGPAPSASKLPDDGGGYTDPDWVKLPRAEKKQDGLPVKFAHNGRGAAAMAVAANRAAWSFDKAKLKRVASVYSTAKARKHMEGQAGESADAVAQFCGVPLGQTPPRDASVSAWVIGVQWKPVSADRVRVFTLTRISCTPGDGAKSRTRLQSVPGEVVWEAGDWKTPPTPKTSTPTAPEPAELGSERFRDEGWKAIQEGDRR